MKVKFKKYECETYWGTYANPNFIALQLMDNEGPVAVATVNLWDPPPPADLWDPTTQVWIKDWSENEGMYDALVAAKVIEPTDKVWRSHFVIAKLGTLTTVARGEITSAKVGGRNAI